MHVGSVLVLDPPAGGFDYDKLVDLVGNRIAYVPRYRQRVQEMPSVCSTRCGSMTPIST